MFDEHRLRAVAGASPATPSAGMAPERLEVGEEAERTLPRTGARAVHIARVAPRALWSGQRLHLDDVRSGIVTVVIVFHQASLHQSDRRTSSNRGSRPSAPMRVRVCHGTRAPSTGLACVSGTTTRSTVSRSMADASGRSTPLAWQVQCRARACRSAPGAVKSGAHRSPSALTRVGTVRRVKSSRATPACTSAQVSGVETPA